jgi:hypothetical protein
MFTALENGQRSPRKLLRAVATRLLGRFEPAPPSWLFKPDPPSWSRVRPGCGCFGPERNRWPGPLEEKYKSRRRRAGDVKFHAEPQDSDCDAWKRLLDLVEEAAANGSRTFAPLLDLPPGDETRIVTLPPTIAKLKAVSRLDLYASHLVRIPPQIGEMSNLKDFDPYTSHRLHWFPYEITRCRKLRRSRVSTRALYGNFKFRPPFPRLEPETVTGDFPSAMEAASDKRCSVCDRRLEGPPHRVWISLLVATDVLPVLVTACSEECIQRLPRPAEGYVQKPHRGGLELKQPDTYFARFA